MYDDANSRIVMMNFFKWFVNGDTWKCSSKHGVGTILWLYCPLLKVSVQSFALHVHSQARICQITGRMCWWHCGKPLLFPCYQWMYDVVIIGSYTISSLARMQILIWYKRRCQVKRWTQPFLLAGRISAKWWNPMHIWPWASKEKWYFHLCSAICYH